DVLELEPERCVARADPLLRVAEDHGRAPRLGSRRSIEHGVRRVPPVARAAGDVLIGEAHPWLERASGARLCQPLFVRRVTLEVDRMGFYRSASPTKGVRNSIAPEIAVDEEDRRAALPTRRRGGSARSE